MKTNLLIAFFSLGYFFSNAQTNISNDTLRLEYDTVPDVNLENTWHISLKNNSATAFNFKIKKIIANGDTTLGHDLFFCEASNCYGKDTYESPAIRTINANSSYSFTSYFNPGSQKPGVSKVKYEIYNVNNPTEKAYIFFIYTAKDHPGTNPVENHYINLTTPTGISEKQNAENAISIFPNPCNNSLLVTVDNSTKSTIAVCNLIGEKVIDTIEAKGSEKIEINTSKLNEGIYYLKLENENKTSTTKKFVVTH